MRPGRDRGQALERVRRLASLWLMGALVFLFVAQSVWSYVLHQPLSDYSQGFLEGLEISLLVLSFWIFPRRRRGLPGKRPEDRAPEE